MARPNECTPHGWGGIRECPRCKLPPLSGTVDAISIAVQRAREKHPNTKALLVALVEENLEVMQAAQKHGWAHSRTRDEIYDTIAVLVRMLEEPELIEGFAEGVDYAKV